MGQNHDIECRRGGDPHPQTGCRVPEGHGPDDLQAGCSQEDPRVQGWWDMAVLQGGDQPMDSATNKKRNDRRIVTFGGLDDAADRRQ